MCLLKLIAPASPAGDASRCCNPHNLTSAVSAQGSQLSPGPITASVPSPATSSGPSCSSDGVGSFTLPSLLSICGLKSPTLFHVPKSARVAWAAILTSSLDLIIASPSDPEAWTKLFMLPKAILSSPPRGVCRSWSENARLIKDRIKKWNEGEHLQVWYDRVSELSRQSRHRRHGPPRSPRAFNAARARRFVEEGQYRKASQALTSHGLADPDEDSLEAMLQKHPQVPPPDLPNSPPPAAPSLSKSVVKRAVTSFSPGTAPGPSGLRASHLAEAISCPTPSRAQASLSTLSQFSSLLASGNVPSEVVSHLCGAHFWPQRRRTGVSAQLPLVKLCVGWFQSAWPSRYATRQPPLCSPFKWVLVPKEVLRQLSMLST